MRNAFGSYYKRGKRYVVRWTEKGVRKCKTVDSAKEASALLAQKHIEQGNVDSSIDFNTYYKSAVIPSMKRLAVRTREDYAYHWSKIAPIIGHKKIADFKRRDAQDCIDKMPSAAMQRHAYVLMRKICNLAVADDIILKNPVNRYIKRDREKKREKVIYTKEQLCHVLNAVRGTEFALPVMIMCCTGIRVEEYFALNKRDFDFDYDGYAFISIDKALTLAGGKKVLKEPKTATSKRLVCLYGVFVDYLIEHKRYMTNKRVMDDYENKTYKMIKWGKFCEEKGLPYTSFGTMRSIYATLCAEAGCLDSVVCMAMGHSGRTMKERNYQSLTFKAMMMNANCFSDYVDYNSVPNCT